ncbi:hypothetical protein [Bdellovibrio sp. HCB337]|uniref:hypothetical protein n=1 Tax=Bdellovibrio sp. HCB337 TaxID=3394358 RepID=UPI0039A656DD
MKKLGLILFTSLLTSLAHAATEFKNVEDAVKKLKAYTIADIEGDKARLKEGKTLKIDQMFDDLEGAVKLAEKNTLSEDLVHQMERVAIITFINDPSAFAVSDIMLPLYQKNKELFKKAAEKLHSTDRALILETLDEQDKALSDGD